MNPVWTPGPGDLRVLPQLYRVQPEQYPVLDAGGCAAAPGRMHIAGTGVWVLYSSEDIEGCIEEVAVNHTLHYNAAYRAQRRSGMSHDAAVAELLAQIARNNLPSSLWTLGKAGSMMHLLDLTDPAVRKRLDISPADLAERPDSMRPGAGGNSVPIAIGRQAFMTGWHGVRIPSVVRGSINVNLFLREGSYADGMPRPAQWPGARQESSVEQLDPGAIGGDFETGFAREIRRALRP